MQVLHVVRKLVQQGSIEPLVLVACGGHPRVPKLLSPINQSGATSEILLPWIADRDPCNYVEAALMMLHLAEAVAYLHTCGFIHRDIKRSNVRFTGNEAFLIDFDLAVKWQHGDAPLCERVGTRGWYAPEVATDTPCYGSEVDVWGLGLVQLDVLCQISKGESGPSGTCCVYVCS